MTKRDDHDFRNKEVLTMYPSGMMTFGIEADNQKGNLLVQRMMQETLSVSVNNWSTSMGIEITPAQARALGEALIAAADAMHAEAEK